MIEHQALEPVDPELLQHIGLNLMLRHVYTGLSAGERLHCGDVVRLGADGKVYRALQTTGYIGHIRRDYKADEATEVYEGPPRLVREAPAPGGPTEDHRLDAWNGLLMFAEEHIAQYEDGTPLSRSEQAMLEMYRELKRWAQRRFNRIADRRSR
jgi:hypothetical protein